jgi:hypothetical protein
MPATRSGQAVFVKREAHRPRGGLPGMHRNLRRIRAISLALCAVALVVGGAVSAFAQGLYYKEIVRDGRIYVFNNAANADRFEKSGEMGVGITKPGVGPNGETVVGDNERALQLYFFKHGISEVVPDPPPAPPPAPPFRFSGLVFGDYYSFPSHHLTNFEDQHGLWLRRIYFTYDHTFSPQVATRFRTEMNSNGKMAGGSITPYVKDAYLRWTFHGRQQMFIGIHPSLTFEHTEAVWGLRHIEKTPLDLYRVDSSRDTGVSIMGPVNASQSVRYAFQFGNESGNNAETDKFKAVRFTTRYEVNPGFTAEVMFGHFSRNLDADRTTAQIFLGYRARSARAGFQYSYQKRRAASTSTAADVDLDIMSGFVVYDIRRQKSTVFLRVDRFADRCGDCSGIDFLPIDTNEPFTTTIAGFEYYIHPAVRLSPNVEFVKYDSPSTGTRPKNNTAARLTFYWAW